jgi:hypothetical protein
MKRARLGDCSFEICLWTMITPMRMAAGAVRSSLFALHLVAANVILIAVAWRRAVVGVSRSNLGLSFSCIACLTDCIPGFAMLGGRMGQYRNRHQEKNQRQGKAGQMSCCSHAVTPQR